MITCPHCRTLVEDDSRFCDHCGRLLPCTGDQIPALLAEYDACYKTRDHYDTMRWTIGTIFIASAFIFLGASITASDKRLIMLVSLGSFFIFLIWVAYDRVVQPFIECAIDRAWEIEQRLLSYRFMPVGSATLQTRLHQLKRGRGRAITFCLFALVLLIVVARVLIAFFP